MNTLSPFVVTTIVSACFYHMVFRRAMNAETAKLVCNSKNGCALLCAVVLENEVAWKLNQAMKAQNPKKLITTAVKFL